MKQEAATFFSPLGWSLDSGKNQDQGSRPLPRQKQVIALLVIWIAVLDFFVARTNFAILYLVPLVLLGLSGQLRHRAHVAGLLIFLTFGVYALKNWSDSGAFESGVFGYRFVNRVLVVITIAAIYKALKMWTRTCNDRIDPELPTAFLHQDLEIAFLFAVIVCVPLVAAIAVVDYLAPARFNLALLYPIPLFVCAWTNGRRLLWAMLTVLLLLTATMFMLGGQTSDAELASSLLRNRALTSTSMILITLVSRVLCCPSSSMNCLAI